ncbi:GRAM domain-containing protein 4-like isoform X1 [Haliotis rufescens]|uniref:GRAM domain-containing protein 4-like isoform X1 n=1 Tax=Haliotis rufescens TaxID=6454 RepID=UPI001EB007FB|nr:GRAM domain-containing protein 4-like isoform X1 [Haliotis rufescens]XP_048257749.1 GRAM domain-containing protein 4-like isoform X1 [Haliotis rufescens]XP_048257750.1 GRAM domain-containing protein 4-like isoform X1 [Haliotis rufescens]
MSFRQALRSRFKGDVKAEEDGGTLVRKGSAKRPKTLADHKDGEETFEVLHSDNEEDDMSFQSAGSHSPQGSEMSDIVAGFKDADERTVFEQQLNQLQEQLVAVMIENQTLQTELHDYREKSSVDKLRQELEYQKHRNEMLEEKCFSLDKKRSRKVQRSKSDAERRRLTAEVEPGVEITEEDNIGDWCHVYASEPSIPPKKRSWYDRMWEAVMKVVYDVMDDFSEVPDQEQDEDPDGDPLTVKKLKDNIKRFGTEAKPYLSTARGVYDLLTWKSPPYTLIVFIVYMYSVWVGCFLPVMLFCFTFRMFINYLRYRGWNVNFNFFDPADEEKEADDNRDLGVSDKFNLVLQVARKVQNFLGAFADSLEKIKSMLTWRHPPASKQLFFMMFLSAVVSCIFPATNLFYCGGLLMGVKLFLVDFMYLRFPRLRQKYDTSHQMWLNLPTDAEYEKRNMKTELNRYILPSSRPDSGDEKRESAGDSMSTDDRSFCELFTLPPSECPLPGWQGGRRCTLINREKSLTAAFKNGKLYLTRSFLCFERTKTPSPKNIVIPLADITRMEKAKPYSWLPGGGMAIEIAIAGSDKPLILGGLLNRDELFDSMQDYGLFNELPWATGQLPETTTTRNSGKVKQFQNFSIGASYD